MSDIRKLLFGLLGLASIGGWMVSASVPSRVEPFTLVTLGDATTALREISPTDWALDPCPVKTAPGGEYEDAARRFQGIPGIARAPGGRLWATWYSGGIGEGPGNYVLLVTSDDDGKTWSGPRFVIDPPGLVRAFDPVLWLDPQGHLWWFYAQGYGITTWDGRAGVWAINTGNPDAPSPTWSSPSRICDGIMMNKPTVLKNEEWLFPVAVWNAPPTSATGVTDDTRKYVRWDRHRAGAHVYHSRDRGKTIELLGTAALADAQPDEHMIVERRSGNLWMLIRTRAGIAECASVDGGRTWTAPQPSTIPHVASRFFIRRLLSGRLLLVKNNPRMDTAGLAGIGGAGSRQRRSCLTAYLSDDDGETWRGGLILDDRLGVSYPDGAESPLGTIYVISDYNRYNHGEIVLARIRESDILEGRLSATAVTGKIIDKALGPPADVNR